MSMAIILYGEWLIRPVSEDPNDSVQQFKYPVPSHNFFPNPLWITRATVLLLVQWPAGRGEPIFAAGKVAGPMYCGGFAAGMR
jgi:hypothetical protein